MDFLQLMTGVEFPPPDTVLRAYLHFEALTEHEYRFSCVSCGDHPPVVIMGLHRQVFQSSGRTTLTLFTLISAFVLFSTRYSFSCVLVEHIEEPPENFKGEVDVEKFWEAVSKEMIARGFVAGMWVCSSLKKHK